MQRNYNLIKEVASRYSVHVIALNQKALLPTLQDLEIATAALGELGVQVTSLPIPSDSSRIRWSALVLRSIFTRHPYTVNWLKTPLMHRAIVESIRKELFDIVHYDTISLAEYLLDTGGLPKVLNHHNVESAMMLRRSRKEEHIGRKLYFNMEARKLKRYETQVCPCFQVNLTVSELERAILERTVQNVKTEVVPNGVDVDYFKPGVCSRVKQRLVFAGRLNAYANQDAVLFLVRDVWPKLRRQFPNASLSIVGKNPTREIGRAVGGDKHITLTGFTQDVRPYLDEAEVYVCPMRDGGGTRLKILDAMAMGKPVVSTSIGCEGLDVQDGQNVLLANTADEFVVQIKHIFQNHALAALIGRQARELVEEKYSWKRIGKRLCEVYQQVANDHRMHKSASTHGVSRIENSQTSYRARSEGGELLLQCRAVGLPCVAGT